MILFFNAHKFDRSLRFQLGRRTPEGRCVRYESAGQDKYEDLEKEGVPSSMRLETGR